LVRILIADDEYFERTALQKILEDGLQDINVVGLAENGKQAVEMAEKLQPDLILMDIRMPGIDGLEAVEKISKFNGSVKFIIVSAFDTFEYARQAMRFNIRDYLLKPSKAAVIIETVQKVISEIIKEKAEQERSVEMLNKLHKLLPIVETDLVTQLLFDHVHEIHLDEMMRVFNIEKTNEAFVMLLFLIPKDHMDADGMAMEPVYRHVKEKVHNSVKGWVGAMSGRQIPMIIFSEQNRSYRAQASSLIRELLMLSHTYKGIDFFVGIGSLSFSLNQIRHSYHEAMLASVNLDLPSKYCFFEDLSNEDGINEDYTLDTEKTIMEEVRRGNEHAVRQSLDDILGFLESSQKSIVEAQHQVLEILFIIYRIMKEMGVTAERPQLSFQAVNYSQLRVEMKHITDRLWNGFFQMKEQLSPDLFHQLKQYITENAHRNISLEMIAENVKLSPFYVSKLFKEQFGTNYIDFLTECRIEKAKALMRNPEKSLKEITYEVGYNDPNYFSRVFKKICGVAPTDYRKDYI
jgi:two-component system response regulator YesN